MAVRSFFSKARSNGRGWTVSDAIKDFPHRIELGWKDWILSELTRNGSSLRPLAGRDSGEYRTPSVVVVARMSDQVTPGTDVSYVDVDFVVGTNIDDTAGDDHTRLTRSVLEALTQIPKQWAGQSVRSCGWHLTQRGEPADSEDGQTRGTILTIRCGMQDLV